VTQQANAPHRPRSRPARPSQDGRRRFPPDPGPELASHMLHGLDAKAGELGPDEALAFWGTVLDHADQRISEFG
jgi:hypothetical protein